MTSITISNKELVIKNPHIGMTPYIYLLRSIDKYYSYDNTIVFEYAITTKHKYNPSISKESGTLIYVSSQESITLTNFFKEGKDSTFYKNECEYSL
jgi:hypothetical protein